MNRPDPMSQLLLPAESRRLRRAGLLSALSGMLWPAQAGLAALGLGGALAGDGRIALPAGGFLAAGLLRAGLAHAADRALQREARSIVARLRSEFVRRESVSPAPAELGGPAASAALAGEKLDQILPFLTRYQPARMRVAVLPPLLLALAFWQSWAVGVVLLAAGPLIPVFMALVGMAAEAASARQLDRIATMNDRLADRLAALLDLRVLGASRRATADLAAEADDLRRRTMAVLRIAFLSSTVLELFAALGVAMVAVWVGFSLLGAIGWGTWGVPLTPAGGIFLLLVAPDYFQPLRDLAAAWHDRASARAVAAEWQAWRAPRPAALVGTGDAVGRRPGPAGIGWHGLVVQRDGGRTLRYPDAVIRPGEAVAIVGPSGAGKSTLLRLVAGLDRPARGRIEAAGAPLDDDHADAWRARLGWIPQVPRFLDASLRFNVTLGSGRPVHADLAAAGALDVVAALPAGDLTRLGETGGGLSGGEARRIMLARAAHARPQLLLADEPTADLDPTTGARITRTLLALASGGTTLLIATHDPALMAQMDRVIRLEGAA